MQEDYKKELENYNNLWKIFAKNCLLPDFRNSLYSSLALVFIPSFINIYYIFRNNIFKNAFKFGSIITTLTLFHYNLNKDFEKFLQKDTQDSNLARLYIQNISKTYMIFPYFETETINIIKQRNQQENK